MGISLYEEAYQRLLDYFGPQNWWPAETAFEIVVGAVLTQNTNWSNVEKAIINLKEAGVLTYKGLEALPVENLAELIRPSGFFNVKATRLKKILAMIEENYGGDLDALFFDELSNARTNLLRVKGVGPETADAILLYAAGQPIFVIDAYTHRIFSRHNLVDEETDYQSMQEQFMDSLPESTALYNEFHALIVIGAKTFCKKKKPLCEGCPLFGLNECYL